MTIYSPLRLPRESLNLRVVLEIHDTTCPYGLNVLAYSCIACINFKILNLMYYMFKF